MEGAYFCATFAKQHPDGRVVLVPSDPVLAAYAADEKLNLFLPTEGRFGLPRQYLEALDNPAYLGQIRDRLLAVNRQRGIPASAIPQEMEGDDGDMQMRRAYVAFKKVGIPSQLDESGPPSLKFTWGGVAYVYGSDQQVRPANGG
jgi:hypothetical protein